MPGSSIIYYSWLIRVGIDKSQSDNLCSGNWLLFVVVRISGCCSSSVYYHQQLVTSYLFQKQLQEMFYKKKPFLKISQYSLENTSGLWNATLLKKRPQYRCFPVNIAKTLRITILKNTANVYFEVVFIRMISC